MSWPDETEARPTWTCPTCGSENPWGVSFCEGWAGTGRHPIVFLSALYADALETLRDVSVLLDAPLDTSVDGVGEFYAEVMNGIRRALSADSGKST